MSGTFDVTQSLLGPFGGQLAIAFGAGCTAGYAFCIRTIYRLLNKHAETQHADCQMQVNMLRERLTILEDRLHSGTMRQMAQMRESEVRVIGEDKLGRPPLSGEDR
jgi:hypothetical protein